MGRGSPDPPPWPRPCAGAQAEIRPRCQLGAAAGWAVPDVEPHIWGESKCWPRRGECAGKCVGGRWVPPEHPSCPRASTLPRNIPPTPEHPSHPRASLRPWSIPPSCPRASILSWNIRATPEHPPSRPRASIPRRSIPPAPEHPSHPIPERPSCPRTSVTPSSEHPSCPGAAPSLSRGLPPTVEHPAHGCPCPTLPPRCLSEAKLRAFGSFPGLPRQELPSKPCQAAPVPALARVTPLRAPWGWAGAAAGQQGGGSCSPPHPDAHGEAGRRGRQRRVTGPPRSALLRVAAPAASWLTRVA